jgi:hypothetical protein
LKPWRAGETRYFKEAIKPLLVRNLRNAHVIDFLRR